MTIFNGFTSSETFTQVPDSLIRLMNEIDDLAELKVTLYAIWWIEHLEGSVHAIRENNFETELLGLNLMQIREGLGKAIKRQTLLKSENDVEAFYFLNSPRGRLAVEGFAKGQWSSLSKTSLTIKSNIFKLYEENIGAITPLISDMLIEAEKEYPNTWFEEAFEIAVSRNIRNWKYIDAILRRWKEKGKDERKDTQDSIKDAKRYNENEFSEYFKRD